VFPKPLFTEKQRIEFIGAKMTKGWLIHFKPCF